MSAQHTPGPWSFSFRGSSPKVVDTEGKAVCMVTPRKNAWNAHIIVEAPAMLEVLRKALHKAYLWEREQGLREEMEAIINRIDEAGA